MKSIVKICTVVVAMLSLSSCIIWGGDVMASNNDMESNNGIYNIQEPNYTVKQLYDATIKYLEAHPDDYKIQAKNEGQVKAQIYAYSYPDHGQLQFFIVESQGMVFLGIKVGAEGTVAKTNPDRARELEGHIILDVQK